MKNSKITEKQPAVSKKQFLKPRIAKVTVNIGVGEAGERLHKAETVLKNLTGQKPVQTLSKTTNKDWGIRKGMPIGCKVTLRGEKAERFLVEALKTRNNKIADYSFDDEGNFSFGVPDHTLFKDQKYDPDIGIFGMDICVTLERSGYRVKHRRISRRKIPHRHRVTREESIAFISEKYNVEVVT
ncbi:MAG: 50S ribosomal protein L5 [Thermoplasmata archaeon]|nr:MAG: 50S ribosomal protein L5 [Thermoplasmata archaeon]